MCAFEKERTFRRSVGCAHSQPPRSQGQPSGAGSYTPALPVAALQGAGRWSPKWPFSRPSPRTPGTASPLLAMESSISDLEPRRKTPLPSLCARPPLQEYPLAVAQTQLLRSSAQPRNPWLKCQAQCRYQTPVFLLPALNS